ncbi:MAG: hypothetical protein JRG94_25585 [Deltaproteobacteria bacterium]|nr:hypothetical protein [Deltaproteobacteria bacterium]
MHSRKFIYPVVGWLALALSLVGSIESGSNTAQAAPAEARDVDRALWVRSLDQVLSRKGLEGAKVSAESPIV